MSFDRPAICVEGKTQWEALTKSKFKGIRLCFGQLVYYRKSINKRTLDPNMAPRRCFWDGGSMPDSDIAMLFGYSITKSFGPVKQ